MDSPDETHSSRRSLKLLGWAALPVLILAGIVQVGGIGIDILLAAAAGLLLLGLERSIGDWLGEWFGPMAAAAIFVAAAVAVSWFFLDESLGRSQTDRFFIEAERRGYRTAYYQTPRSPVTAALATGDTAHAATPVATGGRQSRPEAPTAVAPSPEPAQQAEETASDAGHGDTKGKASTPSGQGDAPVRKSVLSFLRRGDTTRETIPTEVELTLSPPRVAPARRTIIRAVVRAQGRAIPSGTVDFTVNGLGAGRVQLNGQGVATTTFQTHIPGSYEVRVRYAGSSQHASSHSPAVTLTVTGRESPYE